MRYAQLLRSRAPLLFWVGQLTSSIGDRLYAMTVMWMVMEQTGSPTLMATVSLVDTLTYLLVTIFGGVLTDRWNRMRILIGADLGRAAVVFGLVGLHLTGVAQIWHLLAAAAGLATLEAFFGPARKSVMPTLVSADQIQGMVGLMDATSRLARIVGPGFAGLLLTFVPQVHLMTLNALSFLISAVTLAAIARSAAGGVATPAVRRSFAEELGAGFAIVGRDRHIGLSILIRGLSNIAWAAFTVGVPLLVQHRFGTGMGLYGLILARTGPGTWPATCWGATSLSGAGCCRSPACAGGPSGWVSSGLVSLRSPCGCWRPQPVWGSLLRWPT